MATANITKVSRKTGEEYTIKTDGTWRRKPASAKQVKFIKSLLEKRVVDGETMKKVGAPKSPTQGGASDTIKLLLTCPER